MKKRRLPKSLNSILWSYDLKNVSLERDKEIIITQVLNYGLWEDIKWLLKTYREDEIKKVVANPRRGRWWRRVLNFWAKILDIEIPKEVFENAVISIKPRASLHNRAQEKRARYYENK